MSNLASKICICGHFQGRYFAWQGACAYHKGCSDVILPYKSYSCRCQSFSPSIAAFSSVKWLCGHSKTEHERVHTIEGGVCSIYVEWDGISSNNYCGCHSIKMDNLSYLEECYDRKASV